MGRPSHQHYCEYHYLQGMEKEPRSFGESFRFVVERDYSDGLLTRWQEQFPEGLDQFGVTEDQFLFTIARLNQMFKEAEEYGCTTCFEASIACLSFYSLYLCIPGQYKRVSIKNKGEIESKQKNQGKKRIETFIESQNNTVYSPNVRWLNPYRNGLLNVRNRFEKPVKTEISVDCNCSF